MSTLGREVSETISKGPSLNYPPLGSGLSIKRKLCEVCEIQVDDPQAPPAKILRQCADNRFKEKKQSNYTQEWNKKEVTEADENSLPRQGADNRFKEEEQSSYKQEENKKEATEADENSLPCELKQKLNDLEIENQQLKCKINFLQAEMEKRDFEHQIGQLKAEAIAKDREHTLELALARRNVKEMERDGKNASPGVCGYKKNQFPWLKLSKFRHLQSDLFRKVTDHLNDDELFELRSLNRIFYASFYEQRVVTLKSREFNFVRALWLAKMGRVFKKLEYFCYKSNNGNLPLTFVTSFHFPKLKYLDVRGSCEFLPRISSIRILRLAVEPRNSFCSNVFPNLEKLILASKFINEKVKIGSFPKLRIVEFESYIDNWWKHFTKNKYPSLIQMTFYRQGMYEWWGDSIDPVEEETAFEAALELLEIGFQTGVQRLRSQGVPIIEL